MSPGHFERRDDANAFPTDDRSMPPWKPNAGVPFANARGLTLREIDTLVAWEKAGCPEGDRARIYCQVGMVCHA